MLLHSSFFSVTILILKRAGSVLIETHLTARNNRFLSAQTKNYDSDLIIDRLNSDLPLVKLNIHLRRKILSSETKLQESDPNAKSIRSALRWGKRSRHPRPVPKRNTKQRTKESVSWYLRSTRPIRKPLRSKNRVKAFKITLRRLPLVTSTVIENPQSPVETERRVQN